MTLLRRVQDLNLRTNSTLVRRISSPLHYRSANSPEHLLCKVEQSKRAGEEISGKTAVRLDVLDTLDGRSKVIFFRRTNTMAAFFWLIAIEGCFRFIVKVDPLLSMLYLL